MKFTSLFSNDLLLHNTQNVDLRTILAGDVRLSLHTDDPGLTGANEATGTYYARQIATFAASSSARVTNAIKLKWFNRTGETVIIRTLTGFDDFNRANVPYCGGGSHGIGSNWTAYSGCFGLNAGQLKMGSNFSFPCRALWDRNDASTPVAGQYGLIRLRSWQYRPQMGLVGMVPSTDRTLGGYRATIQPSGGSLGGFVRLYRRDTLLAAYGGITNPMAEWMITVLPFVDHTFIQIQQNGHTWIEYDDFDAARYTTGFMGLDKWNDTNLGSQNTQGFDTIWDDFETGGAVLSTEGGGGSPEITITHLGFWTSDGRFLGSGQFGFPIHCLLNQVLKIEIGDLKLDMTGGVEVYRNKNLDRSFGGLNFTVAPLTLSLHTADPGTTGANEIEDSRVEVTPDTWGVLTDGVVANASRIDFPNIPTNIVTHIGVWSVDGMFQFGFELTVPVNASLPSQTIRFLANRLKFALLQTSATPGNGIFVMVGTSDASFAGLSIAEASLSSAGAASVSFDGVNVKVGVLSSAGVGAAAFVGVTVKVADLSSAGSATAAFYLGGVPDGYRLLGEYDNAVQGNVANFDVTGISATELLIICRLVTLQNSGNIVPRASVDNGSTFFSTVGNYKIIPANGIEADSGVLGQSADTAHTSARSGFIHINAVDVGTPLGESQITGRLFTASSSAINAIRLIPNNGGNITGGKIYVFGR